MNYAEMSDFEINCLIVEILYKVKVDAHDINHPEVPFAFHDNGEIYIQNPDLLSGSWAQFNPCNSWSDAGPIIEKNKIDINWAIQRGKVRQPYARNSDPEYIGHVGYIHDNPLRAAMIVFLMMQEGK